MSDDQQVEQQIQAKGLTAPRVTPARIEEVIALNLGHVWKQRSLTSADP